MNDIEIIKNIVELTVKRYENMLINFRPTKPGGEYLEQNLITNFAIAFSHKFPNANIYTEIPFIGANSNHWNCRLDLYIDNGDTGYIIEVKGSQAKDSLFELIDEDIARIKSSELKQSFEKMSKKGKLPDRIVGVVIADCWGGKNKINNIQEDRWYQYYKIKTNGFENINALVDTFSNEVKIEGSKYKYHILTGIINLDLWKQ